jgi:hypothetical protein
MALVDVNGRLRTRLALLSEDTRLPGKLKEAEIEEVGANR